jgi:hypothetical protein
LFGKFIGPYYRLCPDRNKKRYQSAGILANARVLTAAVRKSIEHAEALMLIENQLLHKEVERNHSQRTQASAHAQLAMDALRSTQQHFDSEVLNSVKDTAGNLPSPAALTSCRCHLCQSGQSRDEHEGLYQPLNMMSHRFILYVQELIQLVKTLRAKVWTVGKNVNESTTDLKTVVAMNTHRVMKL